MEDLLVINKEIMDQQSEELNKELEIEMLKEKLAAVTNEMNQFSYIVTHDLQAPLRTITGFLELLEKKHGDKLEDSAKLYMSYVVKGAVKMKDLIFDLLEFSRLNTANLEMEEVDLNVIVEGLVTKYETQIAKREIKLNIGQLPVILANKKQMNQLFDELIDNAIKFSTDTGAEINIDANNEKGFWNICVKDNGMGIDTAFFEKIFIIFRRLNTDEVKYPGTGVGLTICKKIVELHNGTIWLESAVNKGSEFYFRLPASK